MQSFSVFRAIKSFSRAIGAGLALSLIIGCSQNGFSSKALSSSPAPNTTSGSGGNSGSNTGGNTGNGSQNEPPPASYQEQPLAWESASHPERAAWSTAAVSIVTQYFPQLDKATDISKFCPTYSKLSQNQKINLWADLFASDAYYESGWDPTEYSVDVGTSNDANTWSVGLLQMSVVDQQSYNMPFGYNFANLQTASDNLQLGIAIMAEQIQKYGIVLIPSGHSGLYWSTMNPGGKDDQSANIEKMTQQLAFCH